MIELYNGKVITNEGIIDKSIFVSNGKICAPESPAEIQRIDLEGAYLAPGLIDIHTHGMAGYDFMDGTEEAIKTIAKNHLLNGATTIYPTSLAGSNFETRRFLDAFMLVDSTSSQYADMPGIHLEGPYFSSAQKGAQPEEYLRVPSPEEYIPLLEKYGNVIKRWSAAPELEGSREFALELKKRGIVVSYAHSNADYEIGSRAFEWGFRHFTHLYSGMNTVHRINAIRHSGLVETAFLLDDSTVEIICDGMHLPPELVRLVYKIKGKEKTALITDSMRAATMPDGEYFLGSEASAGKVIVKDGVAWTSDMQAFAGSISTPIQILRTAIKKCNIPVQDAVEMMSLTPAKIMGIDNYKGSIKPGYDADLIVFDQNINLVHVIKNGQSVF